MVSFQGLVHGTCLTAAGLSLQDWNQYQAYLRWVKMAEGVSSCCLLKVASLPARVVPVLHPGCEGECSIPGTGWEELWEACFYAFVIL